MPELRKRREVPTHASPGQQDQSHASDAYSQRLHSTSPSCSFGATLLVLVALAAVAAISAHHMRLIDLRVVQQQILQPLQKHLLPYLEDLSAQVARSTSGGSSDDSKSHYLYTREELALYTGDHPSHKGQIYIAILGQVFDVSKAPQFYGKGEGYGHFAGTDGSKSFITGDFVGDVTDDVSDLDGEACLGLKGWLDFYHETYTYKGKLIGRFYDEHGAATAALGEVHAKAKEGEKAKAARKRQEDTWPSCHMKWTQDEGGSVWCDGGMYPRKLYVEMKSGRAVWRCACFKELGWSDVRKVYVDCEPDAHYCKVNSEAEARDDERDMQAEFEAIFS